MTENKPAPFLINGFRYHEEVTWWGEPAVITGGWVEPTVCLEFPNGRQLVVGASTVRHAAFQPLTDTETPE